MSHLEKWGQRHPSHVDKSVAKPRQCSLSYSAVAAVKRAQTHTTTFETLFDRGAAVAGLPRAKTRFGGLEPFQGCIPSASKGSFRAVRFAIPRIRGPLYGKGRRFVPKRWLGGAGSRRACGVYGPDWVSPGSCGPLSTSLSARPIPGSHRVPNQRSVCAADGDAGGSHASKPRFDRTACGLVGPGARCPRPRRCPRRCPRRRRWR